MNLLTILLGILCAGGGVVMLLFPRGVVYRLVSWRYLDKEAPAAIPVLDRLASGLLILLGLALLFV